jgi:hypothetical protein
LAFCVATAVPLQSGLAQTGSEQTGQATDLDIALSNIILIMHHEIGHALIDQFALPVIGQEEDAVDAFATLMVLETYEEPGADPARFSGDVVCFRPDLQGGWRRARLLRRA